MSTMLHEFGHAVYDKYLPTDIPYLLQSPAHTLSTEAIAILMEWLTKNPDWLVDIAGAPAEEVAKIWELIIGQRAVAQLIFMRWGLVVVHFERELYRDPHQDLNRLWWDYVEKFQLIQRVEGRSQPDWAAKIHLALAPVYYQNYLYGQMVASQLRHYIQNRVGNGKLYDNPAMGRYLCENYFGLGRQFTWNETLHRATGEYLEPKYFAAALGIENYEN